MNAQSQALMFVQTTPVSINMLQTLSKLQILRFKSIWTYRFPQQQFICKQWQSVAIPKSSQFRFKFVDTRLLRWLIRTRSPQLTKSTEELRLQTQQPSSWTVTRQIVQHIITSSKWIQLELKTSTRLLQAFSRLTAWQDFWPTSLQLPEVSRFTSWFSPNQAFKQAEKSRFSLNSSWTSCLNTHIALTITNTVFLNLKSYSQTSNTSTTASATLLRAALYRRALLTQKTLLETSCSCRHVLHFAQQVKILMDCLCHK